MTAQQLTTFSGRIHLTPQDATGERREYACRLLTAGRVKREDQSLSNWLIPPSVLKEQKTLDMFKSTPCYLDHPELFGWGRHQAPRVKDLAGITFDPQWSEEENAIIGNLRLYDQNPVSAGGLLGILMDQILQDKAQGLAVPPIGLSAVFFEEYTFDEDAGLHVTTAFTYVESVDVVYDPGAKGYIDRALAVLSTLPTGHSWAGISVLSPLTQGDTMTTPIIEPVPVTAPEPQAPPTLPVTLAPAPAPPAATAEDVTSLKASIATILARLDAQTDAHTVQNNGPQHVRLYGGNSGIDDVENAVNWCAGVKDARLPPPSLRNLSALYQLTTGDEEWRGMYNPDRVYLASANSSTLPGLVVNAMNKVIVETYDTLSAYRWYEMVVAVQPNDGSLQDMAWITFGGIGTLPEVTYGAAYTELTVDDSKEADSFAVYGGYVGVTRKVLRNSDIARFQAIPRALTIASVRRRSGHIAGIFTAASGVGPTLDDDSVVLFHTATHANLATTAYSIAAWKAARLECYKQTELGSSARIGFWPAFWLGPADLYDQALIDFGYGAGAGGYPGIANNDVNPYAVARPGDPRPTPIAVPEFTNTANWAYLTDPALNPVIMMSYANNPGGRTHPAPELFTVTSPLAGLMFTNDVMPIKVRDEYAYGVSTYRGIGKRNI